MTAVKMSLIYEINSDPVRIVSGNLMTLTNEPKFILTKDPEEAKKYWRANQTATAVKTVQQLG